METLILIARETGDRKYLAPLSRALSYMERSRLKDGSLARFYELKTNRPLYFTKDYTLTTSDRDLPTHYGFKVPDWTKRMRTTLGKLQKRKLRPTKPRKLSAPSEKSVRKIIASMDSRGAWVEKGRLRNIGWEGKVIESGTFIRNIGELARTLAATR